MGSKLTTPALGSLMMALAVFAGMACSKKGQYLMNGNSMDPFIKHGEAVEVKAIADDVVLQRWSVIVFIPAGSDGLAIKRVVGLPDERVTILSNKVLVNGEEIISPATILLNWTNLLFPPHYFKSAIRADFDLKTNEYFVLGDNTTTSYDSRHFGPVGRQFIKGRLPGEP